MINAKWLTGIKRSLTRKRKAQLTRTSGSTAWRAAPMVSSISPRTARLCAWRCRVIGAAC